MATTYLTPGVYVEEVDRGTKPIEGVGTAVAAFIGVAEDGPAGKPTMVANWSQFTDTFGGFLPGAYLAHAVYGYFANGGGLCYVVRANRDGARAELPAPRFVAEIPARGGDNPVSLRAVARDSDASNQQLRIEVQDGEEGTFNLTVRRGETVETFENLTLSKGREDRNAVETVNKESKLIELQEMSVPRLNIADRAPTTGAYPVTVQQPEPTQAVEVGPEEYRGDTAQRTGLGGLEAIDEVTMLCAPDIMAAYQAGALDKKGVQAIQQALLDHCELMGDRVAILDPLPSSEGGRVTFDMNVQQTSDWRMTETGYDSKYGTLYYPWLEVADPTPGSPNTSILVPPSGHIAGVWARNDSTRGVHKAPANEVINGAIGLPIQVTGAEQGILNPNGVNCIRSFPGRGIRIWGARTLSSDPSWRYVNVRRLFNFLEKSIERGTQWAVFEPNDYALWQRIKRDITAFLKRIWMSGALFGATPEQAFFVKCDEENNPPETRDAGQLFIDIGVAPVKPAEFIIFRIGQYSPEQ